MKNIWLEVKSYKQVLGMIVQYNGDQMGQVVGILVLKEQIILVVDNITDGSRWTGKPEVFGL